MPLVTSDRFALTTRNFRVTIAVAKEKPVLALIFLALAKCFSVKLDLLMQICPFEANRGKCSKLQGWCTQVSAVLLELVEK